ncbi:MAG: hypothetical protein AB7U05_16890 [Mangrovibacterium sp.]
MGLLLYILAAIAFSIFAAYKSAYFAATQYWGLKLTYSRDTIESLTANKQIKHYLKKINLNGLQSAITPRNQKTKRIIIVALNLLFFFVGAFSFTWYVPILTLFGILILKNLVRQALPTASSLKSLEKVIAEMEKESRLLEEQERLQEKEASDFFIDQLRLSLVPSKPDARLSHPRHLQNSRVEVI